MNLNFLSYDLKNKNIILLNNKEKEGYMINLLEELQSSIVNYVTQKLSEQEIFLFNFPESQIMYKDRNLFYSIIHKLIEDLKKNKEDFLNFQKKTVIFQGCEKGELELNYQEICGLVNFIINIIEKLPKKIKEEAIHKFSYLGEMPTIADFEINDIKLYILIEKLKNIKTLKICLSNKDCYSKSEIKNSEVIDLKVIQLFCFFFKAFFVNLLILDIDLNIYEINKYFNIMINPYKINPKKIIKYENKYQNIFLGNLLIMQKMTKYEKLCKISFKMYDSYQIELHILMSKYFTKNIYEINDKKNMSLKNSILSDFNKDGKINFSPLYQNKFLFFQHIFPKINREFYDLHMEFNSLDPLLFSNVNILLIRYASLANISITFFDFNQVNYRKTLINSYYYNFYSDGKKNPIPTKYSPNKINAKYDNDYKIYFDYINNIIDDENKELLLLRDEVILNELFPYFNYNLNALIIIMDNKLKDESKPINSLNLDFSSSNVGDSNLSLYDNYNTAIICFIYNLLNILESNKKKCNLSSLDLKLDDFCGEKEFIIRNIQNRFPSYRKSKIFNLKEIKLRHLYLKISNISLFLPFENFPMDRLTELILEDLTYRDLLNLTNALKNDNTLFQNLLSFEINLNLMEEDFRTNLELLIKEYFPKKINSFKLKIPCNISYEDIIDIITWIKKNNNNNAIYYIIFSNSKLSPYVGDDNFSKIIKEFYNKYKKELYKRNIITEFNCIDNRQISLSLKMLNGQDINFFLSFIFCFNNVYNNSGKKIENKNNNSKIFENIFYYRGNFKKTYKEITIEII